MAECDWVIVCDYAFLDQAHKPCLIGIFDAVLVDTVPATHHQASVVLRLVGEPHEEATVNIQITRPTLESLWEIPAQGKLSEDGTATLTANMIGLPLPDFGPYAVKVYIGGVLKKAATLTVKRRPRQG